MRVRRGPLALGAVVIVGMAGLSLAGMALFVEARRVARFTLIPYSAPTHVYARPPVIVVGSRPDPDILRAHLGSLGYREPSGRDIASGEFDLSGGVWSIDRRPFQGGSVAAPPGRITMRLDYAGRIRRIENADGRSLRYAALEPQLLARLPGPTGTFRLPVDLDGLPGHLIDAVLTIEDRRFMDHGGLDVSRIIGASIANIRAGRVVQGGSTITQQLAKNLYLTPRRTWVRKAREAAIAIVLERRYSKERILAAYLNEVYLGQDGGVAIHGIGAASRHYFGRDASDLSLAEAALLAGMIRGPNLFAPKRDPTAAAARRDLVLREMRDRGLISESAFSEAASETIETRGRSSASGHGRYFVDHVRTVLEEDGRSTGGMGLAVFTTLDGRLQEAAEAAVESGLSTLESRYSGLLASDTVSSTLQAALVAINPYTGELLAMVGGRNYGQSQFNRAVNARRQPGSSFKPVVTLAALADGGSFTLASLLDDAPLTVETPAGPWRPVNYDERFRGPITLRSALERSLNVPFARLGLALGPQRIVETARRLGITGRLMPVPSIALGASEVSPLELTGAYGVIAAGGYRADPQAVLGVVDAEGQVSGLPSWRGNYEFTAAEAYLVTSALRGAVERGTGRSLAAYGFHGDVAAKSGTTNNYRDGWFVGYTPELTIGVWVGFDDGRTLGLPGSQVALPIFADFLGSAVGASGREGQYGSRGFRRPAGLDVVEIDPASGLRAGPGCRGDRELFLRGTAPRRSCTWYERPSWRRSLEPVPHEDLQELYRRERAQRESAARSNLRLE